MVDNIYMEDVIMKALVTKIGNIFIFLILALDKIIMQCLFIVYKKSTTHVFVHHSTLLRGVHKTFVCGRLLVHHSGPSYS